MINRKRKNLFIKIFSSQKLLALLGLIIIILISLPLAKNVSRRYRINQEIKELEKEISALENKNLDFKELVSYLESDQFVEEQARLKLGLKKEGEAVAVISGPTTGESPAAATSSPIYNIPGLEKIQPAKPISNLERWWRYFFEPSN
ncbi:hypothetical protein CO116_03000 [Candidatus Falkowbacteria bacterium CG_4_9_14_3_um_filter_38_19]|uniref:Septum formation initiator n=2 Tax=Candidatus Falkowiibacteriota TaxID=1752728 RepID=A0A2M6WRW8_9BACT|nr:septum formation initiator family protein [Candidatus Falkowbacteria bacterium]PIT95557.1 MAG: hypothetical protein COT96_00565 [Candidatus Falkowbacteria bacterium CG10_big_fil_rev_8_21_14_0_10_38_22]PJB15919.1 MAG: hypothetical protein CO116_03000 [Candidatus Falkowbacteria bacterium CG_4_9_14_3_um_filter_38_19]